MLIERSLKAKPVTCGAICLLTIIYLVLPIDTFNKVSLMAIFIYCIATCYFMAIPDTYELSDKEFRITRDGGKVDKISVFRIYGSSHSNLFLNDGDITLHTDYGDIELYAIKDVARIERLIKDYIFKSISN